MNQEKIQQLQLIEQNIQHLLMQKQSVQADLIETESALEELEGESEAYRVIGNLMVKVEPEKLREELKEKKTALETRVESFGKQEQRLREKAQQLQKEALEEADGDDS